MEQLESSLLKLSREERREFIQWFYRHEAQIFEPQEDDALDPTVEAELLRRLAEFEADPSVAVPVTDEWFDDLKRRIWNVSCHEAPRG